MTLPKLLAGLLVALFLAVILWPGDSPSEDTGGSSANGNGAGRTGDSDTAGDTIRTLTARISDFQHQVDELSREVVAARQAREELSRRVGAVEDRPAALPVGTPNTNGDAFTNLTSNIERLQGFTADPLSVKPPSPPSHDMPVGLGFDPILHGGNEWVGPEFHKPMIGREP